MLLIFPPVAKACEPPAGIAALAGSLRGNASPCSIWDANLEGQLFLLRQPITATDTWSRRAARNLEANLAALRNPATYHSPDRYQRAVNDLNHLLARSGSDSRTVGLTNYQERELSPQRGSDLLRAAARPEIDPFFPFFSTRLERLLDLATPSLVGISLNYLSQALTTFALIGLLRQRHPGLKIVLGGGLVTSWLSRPDWRNPFGDLIDELIAGPGEIPLLKMAEVSKPWHQCPPDFDQLPLPEYLAPGLILPYAASSGCYWRRCSFCPEKAEGNPWQVTPSSRVLADLELLRVRHQPRLLHLLDNAVTPALLQALAKNPPGMNWYGFARAEPLLAEPEFCRALRASGCVMLKLGLESGDQAVLDGLDKGIDLALVEKVLAALAGAGIATYVYLLFGTPPETLPAARRTLEFVVKHQKEITFLNLAIFNLPLGSSEAATLELTGFYDGDLSLYQDFLHPAGWHRREVRRFLDREFRRHPDVSAILRRDPPFFTSNHAPFFIPRF
jgi:radical SAM superfamily enzyme YgiQ (UPF0313 family)